MSYAPSTTVNSAGGALRALSTVSGVASSARRLLAGSAEAEDGELVQFDALRARVRGEALLAALVIQGETDLETSRRCKNTYKITMQEMDIDESSSKLQSYSE